MHVKPFLLLEPVSLKAFYFAARELSFTRAADRAGLTQSGVSQHIKKLEDSLNTVLFYRIGKTIELTSAGKELYKFVNSYLLSTDSLVDTLHQHGREAKGLVRCVIPDNFMQTSYYERFLDSWQNALPSIDMHIIYGDTQDAIERLEGGETDFAFIKERINTNKICLEEYVMECNIMVASRPDTNLSTWDALHKVDFICYPGMAAIFDQWFVHNYPKVKPLALEDLRIKANLDCFDSALHLVEKGLGIGIFPINCVEGAIEQCKLYPVQSAGRNSVEKQIFMATLHGYALPFKVKAVIDCFKAVRQI